MKVELARNDGSAEIVEVAAPVLRGVPDGPVELWMVLVDADELPMALGRIDMTRSSWIARGGRVMLAYPPTRCDVVRAASVSHGLIAAVSLDWKAWQRLVDVPITDPPQHQRPGDFVTLLDGTIAVNAL